MSESRVNCKSGSGIGMSECRKKLVKLVLRAE